MSNNLKVWVWNDSFIRKILKVTERWKDEPTITLHVSGMTQLSLWYVLMKKMAGKFVSNDWSCILRKVFDCNHYILKIRFGFIGGDVFFLFSLRKLDFGIKSCIIFKNKQGSIKEVSIIGDTFNNIDCQLIF